MNHIGVIIIASLISFIILYAFKKWKDGDQSQSYITTVETNAFSPLISFLSKPKRIWGAVGTIGIGITSVIILISSMLIIWLLGSIINSFIINESVVIPFNTIETPFSFIVLLFVGLILSIVIHEIGHGIYVFLSENSPTLGIKFIFVVPLIAYVKQQNQVSKISEALKISSGGILFNTLSIIIAAIILFVFLIPLITTVSGAGVGNVVPDTGFDKANIQSGDIVTEVNGTTVKNRSEAISTLNTESGESTNVKLKDGTTKNVKRNLTIAYSNNEKINLQNGESIKYVNKKRVYSENDMKEAVGNESIGVFESEYGTEYEIPVGVLFVQNEQNSYITHIDGKRIHTFNDLVSLNEPSNEHVTIKMINKNGDEKQINESINYIITNSLPGMSGLQLTTYGVSFYPSNEYVNILSDSESASSYVSSTLNIPHSITSLPFIQQLSLLVSLILLLFTTGSMSYSFTGFTGMTKNYYEVQTSFSIIEELIFISSSIFIAFIFMSLLTMVINSIPMRETDGWKMIYYYTYMIVQYGRKNNYITKLKDYYAGEVEHGHGDVLITNSNSELKLYSSNTGNNGLRSKNKNEYYDPYAYNIMDSVGQVFKFSLLIISVWFILY